MCTDKANRLRGKKEGQTLMYSWLELYLTVDRGALASFATAGAEAIFLNEATTVLASIGATMVVFHAATNPARK